MPRISAGLVMCRMKDGTLQVLLAHPGGPYFRHKDTGTWSIPKGEPEPAEDLQVTAQREFEEETGVKPAGPFIPLRPITQKGGKIVHAGAFQGDCDPAAITCNTARHLAWLSAHRRRSRLTHSQRWRTHVDTARFGVP